MGKGVVVFLLVLLMPIAYSISIKELIARYSFSAATPQMNVTGYADFMVDKNNNGINDTLVIELATNNLNGNFIFIIDLFDKNGILANETNKTLNAGVNKLNITFSSILLNQNQFNYSIKIYNSSYNLKYRKDNIPTQSYLNFEDGFKLFSLKDSKVGNALIINATLNSSINGIFEAILFLAYNNSVISVKENKSISDSAQDLIFNFGGETIKRTHYIGSFNISSIKIGKKMLKTSFTTGFYDFKDFAVKSYITDFSDDGIDADSDNQYDILRINANTQILEDNEYSMLLALYDLFGNIVEIKNASNFLNAGNNIIPLDINGSRIYDKKFNGPFIVKYVELYGNNTLIDKINDAYVTGNYNFNDFDKPNLPDLRANISVSGGYHYGINNAAINITFENIGNKHAFNIFTDIFDNASFSQSNRLNVLNADSKTKYQIDFSNISDFEISAIVDLQDFVEESNESNNAEKIVIKLNKRPSLDLVDNITVNEGDKILVNLSAFDPNGDALFYSINLSKFSKDNNLFIWNTSINDNGEYTLSAAASDGFLNDSVVFRIIILDIAENDIDSDGIDDSIDKLIGNASFVNSSTINLTIFVNNSKNLSKVFNEAVSVKFVDNNLPIAEFNFDFSRYRLNLTNLAIGKQSTKSAGWLLIRGLEMPFNATKTMYVDGANPRLKKVCIRDAQIPSINKISRKCNSRNETKVACNGRLTKSYRCTYNSTTNKYKVQGLKHTGIIQVEQNNFLKIFK